VPHPEALVSGFAGASRQKPALWVLDGGGVNTGGSTGPAGSEGAGADGQTVAGLGEWGLIAALAARLPPGPGIQIGIGDDAAVLAARGGSVVAAVDLLLEGRHFLLDWSSAADIGHKAAARSLADIAAMGAVPSALLVGLGIPGSLPARWALDLASGLAAECARAGAAVVGGDTARADSVILSVTALGDLAGRPAVTRAGARPGEVLAIAGPLGHSAAGHALLAAGAGRTGELGGLIAAHLRPSPPYDAGPEAAALSATAMIDISDGLFADLGHIAEASGAAIDVDTASLDLGDPLAAAARAVAAAGRDSSSRTRGGSPAPVPETLNWVLTGGEDHCLAATFPPDVVLPPRWHVIGTVRPGTGVLVDGKPYTGPAGWEHFR
jgi:thiamine-monophosphate kinase